MDETRGIFLVVDGVGGQAAGEKAAETAVETIAQQMAKPARTAEDCVRQAITAAGQGCAAALMSVNWLGEREHLLQPLDGETVSVTAGD